MEVVTFYSYKGGVGRTLLLAWVARALAARGKRVVALDLDLEAPGLPSKLRPESEPRAGFGVVDLLLRFQGGASPPTDLEEWCLPVATERGSLWLVPAGAAPSPAYWHALSKISWETLFVDRAADGARFFLWLRDALAKAVEADFLLVDARTGVTEMGAAAVGLLADTVIAVTNTSPESKTGLREVLRAAVGSPRVEDRQPLRVLPVLSRVPALLGADDDARLVDQLQRFLNEEAEPLTSTLASERVVVVHHEEALLEDEQRVLAGPRLRVCADYDRVLAWLVREAIPGPVVDLSLPRSSHLLEIVRAQEEIVAGYRRSAELDSVSYMPLLADALTSLVGNALELGRREQALAIAEEIVALRRELAQQWPGVFSSTLANDLQRLGSIYSELGRIEEALTSIEGAVVLWRQLVTQGPSDHLPELAQGLRNLSDKQRDLGRRNEALASMAEAVGYYRGLASQKPNDFLPSLATSLIDFGAAQWEVGEREEALTSTAEAIGYHRALAEQRPELALSSIAAGIGNWGAMLRDLGKGEEPDEGDRDATDDDDMRLLRDWRGGDRRAGNALIRRHYAYALGLAKRRLTNDADAIKATQNAMTVLVQKKGVIEEDFRKYLGKVVYFSVLTLTTLRSDEPLQSDAASTTLTEKEEDKLLVKALRSASIDDQLVFYYEFVGTGSRTEIARLLGLDEGGIFKRIHEAKQRLRKQLEGFRDSPTRQSTFEDLATWRASIHGKLLDVEEG